MDPPAPFHPGATRRVRQTVRVGVGVIVLATDSSDNSAGGTSTPTDNIRVYAGIRKGSHGAGTLALPGGHLEMFESWEECAQREIKEEMDLDLDLADIKFLHVTNDIMKHEGDDGKHYVTIFMVAQQANHPKSLPVNMEPEKCEGWQAYSWGELCALRNSGKLFGPLQKLVEEQPPALKELFG